MTLAMGDGVEDPSGNEEVFTLRIAVCKDEEAVTTVLESAYPALMASAYEPAVLASTLPAMTRANPTLLASGSYYVQQTSSGKVVACGGWSLEEPGSNGRDGGLAHVRHFGTHAEWTRRGLGKGIFGRCRSDALAAGVRMFRCFASLNAEPFYASMGFYFEKRFEVTLGNGLKCPTVLMTCLLDR